ncbi:MAG: hypothetical protein PVF05_00140 [Gemmatimonadales bacterium]|jgi:hypothetical protein
MTKNAAHAAALLLAAACTSCAAPGPEAGTFGWESYTNHAAGFTMEVPDVYAPDEEGSGNAVLFRWKRGVPVKAYWTTAEEAAHRGLWFGESSVGPAKLGGVEGRRYEYRHCDGPFCSRMVSFVIPWRGRELGLEFRSDGPLNATNRRILESFELDRART